MEKANETTQEMLQKQLQLLSKHSMKERISCSDLAKLSELMVLIVDAMKNFNESTAFVPKDCHGTVYKRNDCATNSHVSSPIQTEITNHE